MFIYDLTLMGRDFNITGAPMDQQQHLVNTVAAGVVLDAVVNMFNTKDLAERDKIIDDTVCDLKDLLGMFDIGSYMLNILSFIETKAAEWYWDPQIKVKLIRSDIDRNQKRALIKMDLESTLNAMIFKPVLDEHLEDAVIENPTASDMETFDEKFDLVGNRETGDDTLSGASRTTHGYKR